MANFSLNLADLNGSNGFRIDGIAIDDQSGFSVSSAGDVNGDGIDDLIIGAPNAEANGNSSAGQSYVVFGRSTGFAASFDLSSLNGSNGFRIDGIAAFDRSGESVSSAGDVNGDGIDDLIIGASGVNTRGIRDTGRSYVLFGSRTGFASNLSLSSLNGSNGFRIDGIAAFDRSGSSVSSAGDINGDGIDDLIIGAPFADVNGNNFAGQSYIVFGRSTSFALTLNLANLNGNNGFVINGIVAGDNSGSSVSGAGDVNGDGIDDLVIGVTGSAGEGYVVFGSRTAFSSSLNLSSLNGNNGFRINGIDFENFGNSVSNAGDVNGDDIDDLIIGENLANINDNFRAGRSYVLFGSSTGFARNLNLSDLNGTNGFRIEGLNTFDQLGFSVSSAGDINGDGIGDLIVGAPFTDLRRNFDAGQSYLIFGRSTGFDSSFNLSELDGTNGFAINGIDRGDNSGRSVSDAGDINGDGIGDLIIGASGANPNGRSSGQSYVIYGNRSATLDLNGSNNGIDYTTTFVGNPIAAVNNTQLTLTDNSNTITGATVRIANPLNGAAETLSVNVAGTNVTANYDSNTSTLTLSGSDTLVNYRTVLRRIIYDNTSINPTVANRTLEFVVTDAGEFNTTSVVATTTIQYSQNQIIDGTAVADTIDGLGGNDTIDGGSDNDLLLGSGGNDLLLGGAGLDTLVGGSDNDSLFGGSSHDLLRGNGGNDLLDGGAGNDTITGGTGIDRFVLRTTNGTDTINDFINGQDSFFLAGSLTFGSLRISQSGSDTLITNTNTSEVLAVLLDISAAQIDENDFTTV
jgi:hypothetical protein